MEQIKIYEMPLQAAVAKRCEFLAQFYYKSGYKNASLVAAKKQVLEELERCIEMVTNSPKGTLPKFREIHYEPPKVIPSDSDMACPSCGANEFLSHGMQKIQGLKVKTYKCKNCGRQFVPKD